jgi:transposase
VPVNPQLLSREELLTLVADQAALIEQLRAEIAELRRRLDQDSSNSSRPPSSDSPYGRPKAKASGMPEREGPRRKPGKQRGAPGKNRRQVPDPDETIPVEPQVCTGCGTGLADAPVLRVFKRQVFEASPPPPPRVIQFNVAERQCPCCGTVNQGKAPAWASGRVQWGPGVAARAVLATIGHHLPYERAARLLALLAGLAVSVGFLVKARRRAADLLAPFMAWVRGLLHRAGLLHVDETTARADGGLTYLHVACNDAYTVMHTGGRSNDDIDAGEVLVDYSGIIVRDGYAGYQHFVDAVHAWCGAHSLRDLKGLHDADPQGQPGAKAMATTLVAALRQTRAARDAGATALTDKQLSFLRSCYAGAIKQIREDNQAAKTPLHQRGLTLAHRFATHRDMILRFIDNLTVPFTNNAAEREIRPVKVKQRSGGCWRTLTGLADFAIIWSYLSTATKHGLDHLDVLTQLFTTGPWLPPEPAPA